MNTKFSEKQPVDDLFFHLFTTLDLCYHLYDMDIKYLDRKFIGVPVRMFILSWVYRWKLFHIKLYRKSIFEN